MHNDSKKMKDSGHSDFSNEKNIEAYYDNHKSNLDVNFNTFKRIIQESAAYSEPSDSE